MSGNKRRRQDSAGEAAEGNDEPHPTFSRNARRIAELSTPFSPNSFPYSCPPDIFDVSSDLPNSVPPEEDKDEEFYWNAEQTAFINSPTGLKGANWIGKRPLGSGAFGTAGLWERRDENNAVVERLVIKESKTVSIDEWKSEVPEEVKMMQRMKKTNCQSVPGLISYKRYMHVRKHRIYMEYCPYNDLATLNLKYKRFRAYFPEPFLWHTFSHLVKVAAAMERGIEDAGWDRGNYQIVHRDLKPANIFVGYADGSSELPIYPVVKTGDWGLAIKIMRGDSRNPINIRNAGTEPYYAPEQRVTTSGHAHMAEIANHLNGTSPLHKISARTNVWGIGAIMFELLTHEAVVHYLDDEDWTVSEAFKDIPNFGDPKYSGALTELIRLCLMPHPWDRPSIEELELKIKAKCRSIRNEHDADRGLREKDRLYYRGSEINEMRPGGGNYWKPDKDIVPHPSDPPDSGELYNPSTTMIKYPAFPSTTMDKREEGGRELQRGAGNMNEEDGGARHDRRGDAARNPIVLSDDPSSSPSGSHNYNPAIISDDVEEDGIDRRVERRRTDRAIEAEEGNSVSENHSSSRNSGTQQDTSSEDSDDTDNDEVRRRAAIKTLPPP